jgi:transposase
VAFVTGAAKQYATVLGGASKQSLIITCAMAHRANRVAFALVRDRATR